MKKRHPNHRHVKIHRSYTVEEIADLFGAHKHTVRGWVKSGLAVTDDKRPMLILGSELVKFLKARRTKHKRPCKPGEIYCVRCRSPRHPAGEMAEYQPVTERFGNLIAICPECGVIMNRRVSLARINQFCARMEISFPQALRHIVETSEPTVNIDLKQGRSEHEKAQSCQ